MITKYFTILLLFLSSILYAQEFPISNYISSSHNMNIYNIQKMEDGFLVYGDFRGTMNVTGNPSASGFDVYLIKYNNNFELQWMEQIGGNLIDFAYDLKVAADGNIYMIGSFTGTCSFESANTLTSSGSYDAFLAKYTSNGSFVWGKKVAYNDAEQFGTSLDIDSNGDLIIGGYYSDSVTVVSERFTEAYGMYFAKLDTDGNLIWAKSIASTSNSTQLQSLSAFDDGYYFNGNLKGTVSFDLGNVISNSALYTDVFLYKTDFNGNGSWVRRTYGDGNALTGTIASDAFGSIYFTGYFAGSKMEMDFDANSKSETVLYNNGSKKDFFVLNYNKTGTLTWASDYGQSGEEFARDIKYQNNFLYITGYFSDTLIFGTDTLLSGNSSDLDAFLGMIDKNGNSLNVVKIEDSNDGNDSGMELSTDDENNAYWGGYFTASSIIIGDSTYVNPNPGRKCIFLTKYKPPYVARFTKKTNVSCKGESNGELIVTPYFGVLPYTYSWSHNAGLNDSTATGLSAGTYSVTVTDNNGATATAQYTITEPGEIVFDPALTSISSCNYSAEGAINLNMRGGNGSFTYLWSQSNGGSGTTLTDEDQSGLTIGHYTVNVTDSKGCTNDTTIVLSGPDPVIFSNSSVTNYTALIPGSIDLELVGGTGTPGTYAASWSGPSAYSAATQDINSLSPGTYTVTVTDDNACTYDSAFTVLDNDNFFAYISNRKDACLGTANGKATASFYSPVNNTNMSYSWNDPLNQTTATASNLAPGRYYVVTVTDIVANESSKDSVYINELAYTFAGSLTGTSAVNCKGDNNGYIDLSITSAGITPYVYNWSTSETTQDISGLGAGAYSVTVTDKNECTFTISDYTITEPAEDISASIEVVSTPSCNGNNNGSLKALPTGGNGGYTYLWNDPGNQTTQTADDLSAGSYQVLVNDSKGCQTSASKTLSQPDPITVSGNISHVTCNGGNNGTITLTVDGGLPAYSYSWSSNDGSGLVAGQQNQSALSAGTYTVTTTDVNLCSREDSYVVSEPEAIVITTESSSNIACFGEETGTITIAAEGGSGSLLYSIDGGSTFQSSGNFVGLAAGNYQVVVKDDNDCSINGSLISILEPQALTINSTTIKDITCSGLSNGSLKVTASGGTGAYTFRLNTINYEFPVGSFQGLSAGTYTVKVKDANACEITTSDLIINEPDKLIIESELSKNITCNGLNDGEINIAVSGGTGSIEYSIDNGLSYQSESSFTNLGPAADYQVKVRDANLCSASGSTLSITNPAPLTIDNELITQISCNGLTDGEIVISASGGTGNIEYSIDNGIQFQPNNTFSNLSAAVDYQIKVRDENLCETSGNTVAVISPAPLSIDDEISRAISCYGLADGEITISASGGTGIIEYSIDNGNTFQSNNTFPNLAKSSNYQVAIRDANLCETTGSILSVSEPEIITISEELVKNISCNGLTDGEISISASGGTGSLEFSIDNGTSYQGSGSFTALRAGDNYQIKVRDENNCESDGGLYSIIDPEQLKITSVDLINVQCFGLENGQISIDASGGTGSLSYSIDGGSSFLNNEGIFTGLGLGATYAIAIKDENDCLVNDESIYEITQPEAIELDSLGLQNISCFGNNDAHAYIRAKGGNGNYSYSIDNGQSFSSDNLFSNLLPETDYYIIFKDEKECKDSTELFQIKEPEKLSILKIDTIHISCYGMIDGKIIVSPQGGTAPYTYAIEGITNQEDSTFTELSAGTYNVILHDFNNCPPDTAKNIEIIEPDSIQFSNIDITNAIGGNPGSLLVEAIGGTGTLTYNLSGDENTSGLFELLEKGDYELYVYDENNCQNLRIIQIKGSDLPIEIYTAFTPNGDGYNEVWNIIGIDEYPNSIVQIFNSWGTKVFKSKGADQA